MIATLRRPAVVDAVLLLALGVLALYGFRDTYDGYAYLVAGITGLLLGMALAAVTRQLGQPPVVLLAGVVLVFFLLGGVVALHGLGGSNLLPVPHTLQQLADCVIHGWKQLLTTLPPVDGGPLLALPYLLGLVAGAAGQALATSVRWAAAPVLVPMGLLALVILLGVQHPRRTAVTAAAFAVLTIVWLVVRSRRQRLRIVSGTGRHVVRRTTAVALCGGVAVAALAIGPHLPGLRSDRVVLRSHVTPPFNVGQYASPLAAFRRFTKGYQTVSAKQDALYDTPLFKVSPSLASAQIRIAALDSYDGNVFGAGNVAGTSVDPQSETDTFQKVGRRIDNPVQGKPVSGTITILDGSTAPGSSSMNVWLPTVGSLTGITFGRPGQQQGSDNFRYNLATSTGVLPEGIAQGDTYTVSGVVPDQNLTPKTQLASGGLSEVDASTFQQLASTWAGRAATPMQQIDAVAAYLKLHGHYTDGEKGYQFYPAGDSTYRMKLFTSTQGQLAGDDEQFSAMMALAANALGVPARVVVGALPEKDGVVKGQDIHAWVELQATDGTWKTLPTSAFMRQTPPQKQKEVNTQSVAASTIPPPAPVHPPANAGAPLDSSLNHKVTAVHRTAFHIPAFVQALLKYVVFPLLLIALVCGSIVGAKRWRRARRRTRGTPAHQLAMAWQELLDSARDHGAGVPPTSTRREQADALEEQLATRGEVSRSARAIDALMFGREVPSAEDVAAYWSEVDGLRATVAARRTRSQRIRAALSLVTFRAPTLSTPSLPVPHARRRGHELAIVEGAVGA